MTTLTSLLVGAHFRPPAKVLLAHLPAGCQLSLVPEPDNPYDPKAIRVLVSVAEVPEDEWPEMETDLASCGSSQEDLEASGEAWLGYVAATGGKPLAARPDLVGNSEVLEAMTQPDHQAWLQFGSQGEALVQVVVPEAKTMAGEGAV